MIKFLCLFLLCINSALADPRLVITANVVNLKPNTAANLTFTFSEAVTGFDISDIHVLPASGGTISSFAGSGSTYTANFVKGDFNSTAIQVDNNATVPAGYQAKLGFNVRPLYYRDSGALFTSVKIQVDDLRCPLPGEILSSGSQLIENYYLKKLGQNGKTYTFERQIQGCLTRLVNGQTFIPSPTPKPYDLASPHGALNHSKLMPQVTNQEMQRETGYREFRVRPFNADCGINSYTNSTSTTSNDMLVGNHNFVTGINAGWAIGQAIAVVNSADATQYMRGRVTSYTAGTGAIAILVTFTSAVGTFSSWNLQPLDRSNGHCFDQGAFRVENFASNMAKDDPIVYPNVKGAAHHHTFFGNVNIDYSTNNVTITKGATNASGGIINNTGYWIPSMIDTTSSTAMKPTYGLFYYKSKNHGVSEVLPVGLKIIAGKHLSIIPQDVNIIEFQCVQPSGTLSAATSYIPTCAATDNILRVGVIFPTCVADAGSSGMQLDSTDHASHLAYEEPFSNVTHSNGSPLLANWCPQSHPHVIPAITELFYFPIGRNQSTGAWRLASDNYTTNLPGGYSSHADWYGGWSNVAPYFWFQRILDNCINTARDCGINEIGLNAGIAISSITASGNVATITTAQPHHLPIGVVNYNPPSDGAGGKFLGRITGVTSTDAAAYNFIPDDPLVKLLNVRTNIVETLSVGTQKLTVTDATHITYNLNYFAATTTASGANMKLQWTEGLCQPNDYCPSDYFKFYYPTP